MDCSLPGSSVHGILQARILEWVAISFSRGSSQPRDRTRVSCIAGRFFFTSWATREFLCSTAQIFDSYKLLTPTFRTQKYAKLTSGYYLHEMWSSLNTENHGDPTQNTTWKGYLFQWFLKWTKRQNYWDDFPEIQIQIHPRDSILVSLCWSPCLWTKTVFKLL